MPRSKTQIEVTSNPKRSPAQWRQFITQVLAFIGLWQVLSGSLALLRHLI